MRTVALLLLVSSLAGCFTPYAVRAPASTCTNRCAGLLDGTQRARCLSYCPGATLTYVDCRPREPNHLVCAKDAERESDQQSSGVAVGAAVVAAGLLVGAFVAFLDGIGE